MSIIEKLLCKVFPYTDIFRSGTQDIYLRRWFLHPRDKDFGKNKGKGRLYLHKFYRGDEDPHQHDHPWPFTSLILTRGYWEETPYIQGDPALTVAESMRSMVLREPNTFETRRYIFYPIFSVLKRPATWKHRVILKDEKPVWTIVKTGVKERSWGFWIRNKLCPWRNYENGVCYCEDGSTIE